MRVSTDIVNPSGIANTASELSVVQFATCTFCNISLVYFLPQHKFSPVLFDPPSVFFVVLDLKTFKQEGSLIASEG